MTAVPLPPRPDPYTGEPRPPAAPLGAMAGTEHPERGEERYLGDPPPGMGPTLEGHKFSNKNAFKLAALLTIFGICFASLYGWLAYGDSPLSWARVWYVWLAIVVVCVGIPLIFFRGSTTTCGADWVMKGRNNWVELYDLKMVKLTAYAGGFHIDLTDHSNRNIFFNLNTIQDMPYIWDYVYNGVVHSVASGKATANKIAVGKLELPLPSEYSDE